jgi:hypothetical protein
MKKNNPYFDYLSASSFEDFQLLAKNNSLSKFEKIGFPDKLRKGYERFIFQDILSKVSNLSKKNKSILDIGAGCSDLPNVFIKHSKKLHQKLYFIDSEEMLSQLPDFVFLKKIYGKFPDVLNGDKFKYSFDVIILYSVVQYLFNEKGFYKNLNLLFSKLNPGGQIIIGDIPNSSMRKRFFLSNNGLLFHKAQYPKKKIPKFLFDDIDKSLMNDTHVFKILQKARSFGYHAWVVSQDSRLPFYNRREDIIIERP